MNVKNDSIAFTYHIREIFADMEKSKIIDGCDRTFKRGLYDRTDCNEIKQKIIDNAAFFAVYIGTDVCGYAAMYSNDFNNKIAYITMFGILPEYQKCGVGGKLMEECIKYARNNGMERIRLEVDNDNKSAITFYNHFSFYFEKACSGKSHYMIRDLCNKH